MKKADVEERSQAFLPVGLLGNKPPRRVAGLPFIASSDNFD
jgi:hypothetical protein